MEKFRDFSCVKKSKKFCMGYLAGGFPVMFPGIRVFAVNKI